MEVLRPPSGALPGHPHGNTALQKVVCEVGNPDLTAL